MQINSIFSSFLATEQIVLSNKEQVIAYAKEETKFEDETYKYKSSKSRHMDKNDPVLQELISKVENGFNTLHQQLGLSQQHKQIVSSLWANDGSNNVAIEAPHRHVDGIISAVYWPIADFNCAPLTFVNPNNQMSYVFCSDLIDTMNEFNSDRVNLQPKEDLCVYFPSWLWHYVSHVLSKSNNRMSFAFNSEVIKKNDTDTKEI